MLNSKTLPRYTDPFIERIAKFKAATRRHANVLAGLPALTLADALSIDGSKSVRIDMAIASSAGLYPSNFSEEVLLSAANPALRAH